MLVKKHTYYEIDCFIEKRPANFAGLLSGNFINSSFSIYKGENNENSKDYNTNG